MKKIIDVKHGGKHYEGYYDEKWGDVPYRVYEKWGNWHPDGWKEHKTCIAKYKKVQNVLYRIAEEIDRELYKAR